MTFNIHNLPNADLIAILRIVAKNEATRLEAIEIAHFLNTNRGYTFRVNPFAQYPVVVD